MSKKILVTGIGGNVGQGILRNILSLNYDLRLVGTDIKKVTGGNHLCDKVYKVPPSDSKEYISNIEKISIDEKIDLIIPATDYETYYLAQAREKLPLVAVSSAEVAHIFLNKYKTYIEFKKRGLPFAETILPSKYKDDFEEFIVKPTEGRGSRDLHVNVSTPKRFSDDFVVQKLYKGSETTTAFYVTKQRNLLGQVTFVRSLNKGTTVLCEVIFKFDSEIEKLLKKIIREFDIRGSCNMQSIVDKNGKITPFEFNCRISGTNSIRSQFGFKDVKYTIDEYLYNKKPKKPKIKKGSATRIMMDVIYPGIEVEEIKDRSTSHYLF